MLHKANQIFFRHALVGQYTFAKIVNLLLLKITQKI